MKLVLENEANKHTNSLGNRKKVYLKYNITDFP